MRKNRGIMKGCPVLLNLLMLSCLVARGQAPVMVIPQEIDIDCCDCDRNSTYVSELLDMVKSQGYQTGSEFYKDSVISVDLNNDRLCEYIVKYYDGGENIINEFYEIRNYELVNIGSFWENSYSWLERFNDYPQLLVMYYDGEKTNPIWKFRVLRYDGDKYSVHYSPDLTYGELRDLGQQNYKERKYELAEVYFRNILTVYSYDNSTDLNNLALSLIKQNKNDEAETLLLNELTERKSGDTFYNLSLVYKSKGDIEREFACLTESNNLVRSEFKMKRIKELNFELRKRK